MSELNRPDREPSRCAANPGVAAVARHEFREGEYLSVALKKVQRYNCYLPAAIAGSPRRYPLLILLHGVTGGWRDWARYTRISRYLAGRDLIVVCPDGGDGWYTNADNNGDRREDDIIQDLLPHLDATLPLQQGAGSAIGGLSMGGYGAVKLALKYPRRFHVAFSHSGAFDITMRSEQHPVFGDARLEAACRHRENPYWLAEQALCCPPTERPAIYLDCGLNDPLLEANRRFSDHLNFMGYGHVYREMPGHHTWPYWDRAFRTVLPEVLRCLGAASADETGDEGDSPAADTSTR